MDTETDLVADRNRWRHEYRIEKQKNALMRSDLRRLQDAARSAMTNVLDPLYDDENEAGRAIIDRLREVLNAR